MTLIGEVEAHGFKYPEFSYK